MAHHLEVGLMATDSNAGPDATGSSSEYIWSLRSQGWTVSAIAKAMDRSSDYISRISRGKTPGRGLTAGLAELHSSGTVTHPPPRRTRKDGKPAKVRSKAGTSTVPKGPSTKKAARTHATRLRHKPQPAPPPAPPTPEQQAKIAKGLTGHQPPLVDRDLPTTKRNLFTHTKEEFPQNGLEYHRITTPRSPNSWNRWSANELVGDIIRDAAKAGKRFHANVIVQRSDGEKMTVRMGSRGGYDARHVASHLASYQFEFDWVRDQIAERSGYDLALEDPDWEIVGIDIDLWS